MLGLCQTENETQTEKLLQAGASGHQRVRQDVKTNFLPKKQKNGRLKDKRGELLGRNIEDC